VLKKVASLPPFSVSVVPKIWDALGTGPGEFLFLFELRGATMLRKWIGAVVVLGFVASVAMTQEPGGKDQPLAGKIVKAEANKVVIQPYDLATKQYGKERDVTTAPTVKVFRMTATGQKQPLATGLADALFKNLPEKGQVATIRLQANMATEIVMFDDEAAWLKSLTAPPKPGN
jgi:hypothetical protein